MVLVRFFFQWNLKFSDQKSPVDNDVLLSAGLVGALFFAARIFDAVTDPVAGVLTDRWVEKGRKRRGLLLFSFFIPGVALLLLFSPSHSWPSLWRWIAMGSGMILFFIGYTFYAIPYWSLVDEYAETSEQRLKNSADLGAGILIATGIVAVVSPLVIGATNFLQAAIIFAIPSSILMLLPYSADPHLQQPLAVAKQPEGFFRPLAIALKDREFVAILVLFCGSQMAFSAITAAAPFIAEVLLGGTDKDVAKLMAPLLLTALPASFLLVRPLRERWNWTWQQCVVRSCLALAVVYLGSSFLGQALIGSAMTTAMILFALAGPMVAVILGLEGEAVVESARKQGDELLGVYFGCFNLAIKGLNGLSSMIVGLLVSLSHQPGWETKSVRIMCMVASAMLILGVVGYYIARPKAAAQRFPTA